MKLLEPVTLIGHSTLASDDQLPFDTKVIAPLHAIKWVSCGRFGEDAPHNVVRRWYSCDRETMLAESAGDDARFDMAEELVALAIKAGRLRCVYVVEDPSRTDEKLVAVRAEQFAGMDVAVSWDDGFTIQICETGSDWDDREKMADLPLDMWFLWEDVAAMRPDYAPPTTIETVAVAASLRPHASEPTRVRDRRGKAAKRWGKLMAGVLRKAASHGLPDAFTLPNKTIGGWLIDVHTEIGATPIPALEDAGRDARALLDALQEILADRKPSGTDVSGVAEKNRGVAE